MVKKDIGRLSILEALQQEGCPACALWSKAEEAYLEYAETNDLTMNPEFRARVAGARGFCNRHMHRLYAVSFSGRTENGLAYANYARDAISAIGESIAQLQESLAGGRGTRSRGISPLKRNPSSAKRQMTAARDRLGGEEICPICSWLLESDRRNIVTLLRMLRDDDEFVAVFRSSDGLCAPHFAAALHVLEEEKEDPAIPAAILSQVELAGLRRVAGLLEERMRKYRYDFRGEAITPEEARSQERAMYMVAGAEGLYCDTRKKPRYSEVRER